MKEEPIEVIQNTKLLGTIISDDLSWNLNTEYLVKKANARMQLLRKVASFSPPLEDLKTIYTLFVRSILEQSAVVWHSSLTQQNINDLERVQKSAMRIILGNEYVGYKRSLQRLEMDTLEDRRKKLCLNFAQKATKNPKTMNNTCIPSTRIRKRRPEVGWTTPMGR